MVPPSRLRPRCFLGVWRVVYSQELLPGLIAERGTCSLFHVLHVHPDYLNPAVGCNNGDPELEGVLRTAMR